MVPGHSDANLGRRRFFSRLTLASGGFIAAVLAVPFVAFLLAPLRRHQRVWRDLGPPDAFAPGSTTRVTYPESDPDPWAGFGVRDAAWLRRERSGEFVAFSVYCTHTGCPVRWVDEAGLFLCPCHGGIFRSDGSVSAGPPPRPLDRVPLRVRDGRLEILSVGLPTPD